MRRFLTLALAAGLAALVTVAALDALEGADEPARAVQTGPPPERRPEPQPGRADDPAWLEGGKALAERLRRDLVGGTLYLSADRCLDGNVRRLRTLSLPDLELGEGPPSQACSFSVSHDLKETAGEEAVWSPRAPELAAVTAPGEVTLVDVDRSEERRLRGSAPAFRGDGALTVAADGGVVAWPARCADAPRCPRAVVSAAAVARALPPGTRVRRIRALAWLSELAVVAVLETAGELWLAAYGHGAPTSPAVPRVAGADIVRADPSARFVGILARGGVDVYDRKGKWMWRSSQETLAFDWSPDGVWLAYATPDSVYLVRTANWATLFRLPVSTKGLAWRE